jgi:hypothetical protein
MSNLHNLRLLLRVSHIHTTIDGKRIAATIQQDDRMSDSEVHDEVPSIENPENDKAEKIRRRWTTFEDQQLRRAIEIYGEGNWVAISKEVAGRTPQQCLHRWTYTLNPLIKKGPWSADVRMRFESQGLKNKIQNAHTCMQQEDRRLTELVNELGTEWTDIARLMGGRTGGQCLTRYSYNGANVSSFSPEAYHVYRWRSHLNPMIKKGKWTEEEDSLILEQRNEYARTWVEISKMLYERCDADVRERYLWLTKSKTPQPRGSTRKWSEEEDTLLKRVVEENGEGNWENTAKHFPDRSVYQCYRRWHEGLDPHLKSGHWTPDEDAKLTELVKEHGLKWALICRFMDGRTSNRCRQRWSYHLDPTLKKGHWTAEEDATILEQRSVHNKAWMDIALLMPGRCGMDIKDRFNSLSRPKRSPSERKRPRRVAHRELHLHGDGGEEEEEEDEVLRQAVDSQSEDDLDSVPQPVMQPAASASLPAITLAAAIASLPNEEEEEEEEDEEEAEAKATKKPRRI